MIQQCANTDACWAAGGTHRASSSRDNSSRGCFFEIKDNAEKNKHVRIPFRSFVDTSAWHEGGIQAPLPFTIEASDQSDISLR
jgi:hypothetical protein